MRTVEVVSADVRAEVASVLAGVAMANEHVERAKQDLRKAMLAAKAAGATNQEIGDVLGVTRQRISQVLGSPGANSAQMASPKPR